MALIAWIVSFCSLLGGIAVRQDMPFVHADLIGKGLLFGAFLACPLLWRDSPLGITARYRAALCLAMILALPLVMLRP